MGHDYALVHLYYTIPPAIILTIFYWPLSTRLDLYKVLFLITIAVVATTPWDAYLIQQGIWSYPEDAILGATLYGIPAEELFFFVVQTYNTSLLYLMLNKATFYPLFLRVERSRPTAKSDVEGTIWRYIKMAGQFAFAIMFRQGLKLVQKGGKGTYMGLIMIWSTPFLLLLWSLAYQFIGGLPIQSTAVPIMVPTVYLWMVDTIALRRGTWSITSGTKYGLTLWEGLDIEEATFFLMTNALIVFGLIAFENALAVIDAFPSHFPKVSRTPSPLTLLKALLVPAAAYDGERILGFAQATLRLKKKSRSFYLASSTFQGRLRIDLMLLYSFCRVADDLIDESSISSQDASVWVEKIRTFLDLSYDVPRTTRNMRKVDDYIVNSFPRDTHLAFMQLPTGYISKEPLLDLLKGFEMDLQFMDEKQPIKIERDLELYGSYVAGTVAEACIQLAFYHNGKIINAKSGYNILDSGRNMGTALQCVNIARDTTVDALLGRVYLPQSWLKEQKLDLEAIRQDPHDARVLTLRARLLEKAFKIHARAVPAIAMLPAPVRGPFRVAVESYMQIGRELQKPEYRVVKGRATVPLLKRLALAWWTLGTSW